MVREWKLADLHRHETVGDTLRFGESNGVAGGARASQLRRTRWLDGDDSRRGGAQLDRCRDACAQAAPSDLYDDRSDMRRVRRDLESERTLAGDDRGIVVRRHERAAFGSGEFQRLLEAIAGGRPG